MTIEGTPQDSRIASSWDNYWRGARHGDALTGGGTRHPAVLSFWNGFFVTVGRQYDTPRIVDIASGNGALVESARAAFDRPLPDFTCIDLSDSAIRALETRFPEVRGVVADARSIPRDDGSFDVAVSQFGLEYAGLDAIDEVTRLIAPGGQLALLLHHDSGGIYRQCAASLDAVGKLQKAGFIPRAMAMFEAAFGAARGAGRDDYVRASRQFVPAIRALEGIMREHGGQVADDTLMALYKDVRTIHDNLPRYDAAEVLDWLTTMEHEVAAYAGRMESMCRAAIDKAAFDGLCDTVRAAGFELQRSEALLHPERRIPLAWSLIAACRT